MAQIDVRSAEPFGLTPAEIFFIAEETAVLQIFPTFDAKQVISCGGRKYGPFRPRLPVNVPLWLGLALKRRGRCQVACPSWMTVEALRRAVDAEREGAGAAEVPVMPVHYVTVGESLLRDAADDIQDAAEVRTLFEDLLTLRKEKLRQALHRVDADNPVAELGCIDRFELNTVRPLVTSMMDRLYSMRLPDNVISEPVAARIQPAPQVLRPRAVHPSASSTDVPSSNTINASAVTMESLGLSSTAELDGIKVLRPRANRRK